MHRFCDATQIARSYGLFTAAMCAAAALNAEQLRDYGGAWQGATSFSFMKPSGSRSNVSDVVDGAIEIKPDGLVTGTFAAAGCTMHGSSTIYAGPTSALLDIRLADCTDTSL
jgi:hypothetical protein